MTARPESPYEAAARVADSYAHQETEQIRLKGCNAKNDVHFAAQNTARAIRDDICALPHPPERVLPVFTGEWVYKVWKYGHEGCDIMEVMATAINTRIAASGFAQSRPTDASDDGPCTDCDDTGITSQTERFCSCDNGLAASKESAIQARIDAAVLAEREACLALIPGGTHCDPQDVADAIRARTTNTEIAADKRP